MYISYYKSNKKILHKIIFVLFILSLIYCGKISNESHKKNDLKISLPSNPMTLDPRLVNDAASYNVIEQIFGFLVKKDTLSFIVPDMAYSWDMPDDRTYVFHLKENIYFHNGSELTSTDVKYTFESILEPKLGSPLRYAFEDIYEINNPDKHTVVFKLKKPNSPFLSNAVVGIVPKDVAEKSGKDFGLNPVGSGPFRFVEWLQDDKIVLEAFNRYYFGEPKIKNLNFRIIPDATTRIFSLETGEIDFLMNDFPPEYVERFEDNSKLKIVKRLGIMYEYIGLNLKNKYLGNKDVRKAIANAIDRNAMIGDFLNNLGEIAHSPLPRTHWAYNSNVIKYDYNPELSKALLDKAGFIDPDGDGPQYRFSLKYKCNSLSQESRQKAQIIQNYLKSVGIQVIIESCEFAKLLEDIKNSRFDLYSLKWVGINDPDIFYKMFHSEGENRNNYFNPHVDNLIELGRKESDINLRKKYYGEIQEIISDDLPYIGLWHKMNVAVMNENLTGFIMYPAGDFISIRDMWWEN
jgi:peptide/nickel transport system substrate-binding protein